MKKYPVELTKEQLEQLGLEVPKFKLSEKFWEGRNTYSVDDLGVINSEDGFYENINEHNYESELPTKDLAEAYKVWTRLMLIQYEMNDGEVLEKGYSVHRNSSGIVVSLKTVYFGIKFKTVELAQQFLEENIEDLENIKIMGF